MRVTAEVKRETERGIREAGRRLFAERGFAGTSTREIAAAAGVATGTVFNYYPTKEALALELMSEALERGRERFEERLAASPIPTVEEALFAHIVAGLRELLPMRRAVGEVLEAGLSPLAAEPAAGAGLRAGQARQAAAILEWYGLGGPGAVAMHLYWTLYLGVLAFWSADASPNREDTLAMVDQAVWMCVMSVRRGRRGGGPGLGPEEAP